MARKHWSCRLCGHRNERTSSRKCQGCGELTKPKLRVPKHAEVLRDTSYATFERISVEIHGGEPGACGVCGREPKDNRNMDRDHGHDPTEISFGRARGLACPGDYGCNRLMAKINLVRARQIVAYLERVEAHYRERIEA